MDKYLPLFSNKRMLQMGHLCMHIGIYMMTEFQQTCDVWEFNKIQRGYKLNLLNLHKQEGGQPLEAMLSIQTST